MSAPTRCDRSAGPLVRRQDASCCRVRWGRGAMNYWRCCHWGSTRSSSRSRGALSHSATRSITPAGTVIHGTQDSCGHGGPCWNDSPSNTYTRKPK